MPALPNARHERFAQELAKGKSQTDAYMSAGYKEDRHGASRLATKDNIKARVSEIVERGAVRAEITVASITERLVRIGDKAEALAEPAGLSVARQATMDTAKLHGYLKDKIEHGGSLAVKFDFSRLDDESLAQLESLLSSVAVIGGGKGRNTPEGDEA